MYVCRIYTIYVVYLAVILIWQFGKLVLICQIKITPFQFVGLSYYLHAALDMALLKFFKQQEKEIH